LINLDTRPGQAKKILWRSDVLAAKNMTVGLIREAFALQDLHRRQP